MYPKVIGSIFINKYIFFKFLDCKWHALKLIRILAKDKNNSISIWDPTIFKNLFNTQAN